MDPRCSPKRIRYTHLSNELPNLQLFFLAGHLEVSISTANTVETQRGASGSASPA